VVVAMPAAKSDIRELVAAAAAAGDARAPSCRLPRGTSVLDVAEDCRRIALLLVVGPLPTTRALEAWLEGPYRSLVSVVSQPTPLRADRVVESPAWTRAYVSAAIRGVARTPSDVTFTYAAIHDGSIERCCDETGRLGWCPVDRPNMRLTERVLSLVAVDYLMRPADWLEGRASKIAV
jgi:hypothetical protein